MIIKKSQEFFPSKPIHEPIQITRIWAQDGWCYIPELKQRQRFFLNEETTLKLETETWTGVLPLAESVESLSYLLFSQKPLVWAEKSSWGVELYEEHNANLHIHS